MAVEQTTKIVGPVDLDVSQIVSFIESDTRPHRLSSSRRREFAQSMVRRSAEFGFRTSVMVGQAMVETGNTRYTGDVDPDQNNFGGIGATGGGVKGASFPDVDSGVLANMAHMAAYIWGAVTDWPEHLRRYQHATPRYAAVVSHPKAGQVRRIADLGGGTWAVDPDYADKIVARANMVLAQPTSGATDMSIFGVPFRRAHIPSGNRNRPGGEFTKTVIVNHETGNTNIGANAEMHRRFVRDGGGPYSVSFHYTVDDREIIELLPWWEVAWHGGDGSQGKCNLHGIAIEICVNADGNWQKTLENAAKLNVWLLQQRGLTPPDVVWQHNFCSGKNCPMRLRTGGWQAYRNRITALYNDKPDEEIIRLPKHPDLDAAYHPDHGFAGYTRWLIDRLGKEEALMLVGYPVTGEFDEDGRTVQYTERLRYEWHPGVRPQRYDVLFGRVGYELIEAHHEIARLQNKAADMRLLSGAQFEEGHGFHGYYRWLESRIGRREALLLVGHPITGEFHEGEHVVQYTERMRFEWHPGARPKRYDVMFGRVAAELHESKELIRQLAGETAG